MNSDVIKQTATPAQHNREKKILQRQTSPSRLSATTGDLINPLVT